MLLESLVLLQGPVLLQGLVLLPRSGVTPVPDIAPRSSVTPASCPCISRVRLLSLRTVGEDGSATHRRCASGSRRMDAIAEFHGRLSSWAQHVPVLVQRVRARQELEQVRLLVRAISASKGCERSTCSSVIDEAEVGVDDRIRHLS